MTTAVLETTKTMATCDFELVGPPGAPVVVALGGISADRHVCTPEGDARAGWWDSVAGRGRALDVRRRRLLGIDWLAHPGVSTADQAERLAAVLDDIGVARVDAVVGASYGGMVALCFAALFPERLRHAVVISAAHEPHPMATALRSIQREIVRRDLGSAREREAVALARRLALTTYRTDLEFRSRFASTPVRDDDGVRFEVEDYLRHKGESFAHAFDAARFLALSESLDLHCVEPADVRVPVTLVSVQQDTLVPAWQMLELRERLGGRATLVRIESTFGHDAFLKEAGAIGRVLRFVLEGLARTEVAS